MSGCVTVTGPPRVIWRRKRGMTLPEEARTLPKRTERKRVRSDLAAAADTSHSQSAFDWPSTLRGSTALSVETSTNTCVPHSWATSAATRVASRLLRTAFQRVRLDQGHMLVRRSVEDDARLVVLEDLSESGAILDVGENGHDSREVTLVHEFAVDLEQVVLSVIDKH